MIELLIFTTVALVAGSGGYLLLLSRVRNQAAAWRHAASKCGLTGLRQPSTAVLDWPTRLEGRKGDLRIRFERSTGGESKGGTRLIVAGLGHVVTLRRETGGTHLRKRFLGEREIAIGDEGFDDFFFVQGSPAVIRALLDTDMRSALRYLFSGRIGSVPATVALEGGAFYVDISETLVGGDGEWLSNILDNVFRVAERLVLPVDIPRRLAENARNDRLVDVRLRNLLTLIEEYPGHAAVGDALRAACHDASDEIRIRAAIAIGGESNETLLEMASRESGDEAYTARAIEALGQDLPPQRVQAILDSALRGRRRQTARACLEILGRHGGAEAVESLTRVVRVDKEELAVAAAQALGATGLVAAQWPLIEALRRDHPDLQAAAARALGLLGTAEAVLPLREAAERFQRDRALSSASRQAIAEIQSRLAGASPGQLSLTGGGAGRLALAGNESGQLSLTDDPEAP